MSDIQIVVPLSALPEETEMTAEGILRAFSDAESAREASQALLAERSQLIQRYNQLAQRVNAAGRDLERILDEVDDPFHKAQALRAFAAELKQEEVIQIP